MNEIQLIGCQVKGKEYAVLVKEIHEIIRVSDMTRIPLSHPCISGVINLRGMVIPVMDLSVRLSLPPIEISDDTRIVVTVWSGEPVGFLVDSVSEVINIPESNIQPSSVFSKEESAELFSGIGKIDDRVLFILNLNGLFLIDGSGEAL